jgi:hypothetical protein
MGFDNSLSEGPDVDLVRYRHNYSYKLDHHSKITRKTPIITIGGWQGIGECRKDRKQEGFAGDLCSMERGLNSGRKESFSGLFGIDW